MAVEQRCALVELRDQLFDGAALDLEHAGTRLRGIRHRLFDDREGALAEFILRGSCHITDILSFFGRFFKREKTAARPFQIVAFATMSGMSASVTPPSQTSSGMMATVTPSAQRSRQPLLETRTVRSVFFISSFSFA